MNTLQKIVKWKSLFHSGKFKEANDFLNSHKEDLRFQAVAKLHSEVKPVFKEALRIIAEK